jgi:hypothetical protein
MNFKQIYEGYKNLLVPSSEIRETISNVRQERLAICNDCPFHSKHHTTPLRFDDHCTDCGCNLDAKSSCLSCSCPKEKWMALTTQDEEDALKQEIHDNN